MNKLPVLLILAGLTVAAYSGLSSLVGGGSILVPEPENPGGPDLLAAFERADRPREAAVDARDFGCLCQAIAERLRYDGRRPDPQLRTGVQLDNFRILTRDVFTEGAQFGQRYPHLAEVAGAYLERELTSDGGAVSDERRRKWISAFESLARSAHYASDYLIWRHGTPE